MCGFIDLGCSIVNFGTPVRLEMNNNHLFYSFEYFEDQRTFLDQVSILGSSIDSTVKRRIDFSKSIRNDSELKANFKQNQAPVERLNINQYDSNDNISFTNKKDTLNSKWARSR